MFKRMSVCWNAVLAILIAIPPQAGLTEAFDPANRAKQPLIAVLTDVLHEKGIDTLYSFGSEGANEIPNRPRLAPLQGFPISDNRNVNRIEFTDEHLSGWVDAYRAADHQALLAVPSPEMQGRDSKDLAEFRRHWDRASGRSRVFISYTKANASEATIVKNELIARGYMVFTYLDDTGKTTTTHLAEVADYFKTAGQRLVIDSKHARSSVGVQIEARYDEVVRQYAERPNEGSRVTEETFRKADRKLPPDVPKFLPKGGSGGIVCGVRLKNGDDLKKK